MGLIAKKRQFVFNKSKKFAEQLLKDKAALVSRLSAAIAQADNHHNRLTKVWDDLMIMFRLVKAWVAGHYVDIPWKSMVLVIGAMVYLLNPFDAIPDLVALFGYMDDMTIIGFVISSISSDLEKFKEWEKKNDIFDE